MRDDGDSRASSASIFDHVSILAGHRHAVPFQRSRQLPPLPTWLAIWPSALGLLGDDPAPGLSPRLGCGSPRDSDQGDFTSRTIVSTSLRPAKHVAHFRAKPKHLSARTAHVGNKAALGVKLNGACSGLSVLPLLNANLVLLTPLYWPRRAAVRKLSASKSDARVLWRRFWSRQRKGSRLDEELSKTPQCRRDNESRGAGR
jgi:hypothetical protein